MINLKHLQFLYFYIFTLGTGVRKIIYLVIKNNYCLLNFYINYCFEKRNVNIKEHIMDCIHLVVHSFINQILVYTFTFNEQLKHFSVSTCKV